MKNLYVILLMIFSATLMGCEKYLAEKSDAVLVTPNTLKDYQAILDYSQIMNQQSTAGLGENAADDFFHTAETYSKRSVIDQQNYRWELAPYRYINDWSKAYNVIYNSNLCLDKLPDIPITATNRLEWNNVKGSALFFRSYYYSQMLWNYAKAFDEQTADKDLGIILREGSDFNVPSARTSVRHGYDQVIRDAKESIRLLPDMPVHVNRPSKAAAYGLLARVYLSMRKYDEAGKYADSCLQIHNQLMDYNDNSNFSGGINSSVPFKQYKAETIFYTEMYSSIGLLNTSRAKIDTALFASYDVNDLRRAAFFKSNSGYYQFKGSYAASAFNLFSGIAVDEILLIRAECYARADKVDDAMNDLNRLLRTRWKKTVVYPEMVALTKPEALEVILKERRKELLMRGLRWIDIKRLNKEGANIVPKRIAGGKEYVLAPGSPLYALPLPYDIITANVPQN